MFSLHLLENNWKNLVLYPWLGNQSRRRKDEFKPALPHLYTSSNSAQTIWPCQLGILNTQTASLQRGKTPPVSVLDMTLSKSDSEVPIMLELWGMWSTPSLPLFPGPLPGVVAPDWALSMGRIELNCVLMLNCIVWNRTVLTFIVCKQKKLYLCWTELFEIELFYV